MVGSASKIRHFLRGRAGNVAIISTLMMPILVGLAGLGIETSMWYQRQRELQGAADIAAYGAALVRKDGGSASDVTTSATSDAITNGWKQAIGTIAVHSPPTSGAYQNARSVEVILTESRTPILTRIYLGDAPIIITARATATTGDDGPACILGLNNSAASTVRFWGNSSATMNNCNVVSNSTHASGFEVGGSADLTAPCAYSAGGSNTDSGLMLTQCAEVVEEHPPVPDPYASVPAPTIGGCGNMPNSSSLSPGCFNGMTFNNGTKTLAAGTYIVNGGELRINGNATVNGTGVMFYLTDGATLRIMGGATMSLSAPTTGTYAGLLFFGDRTQATATNRINGNSTTVLQGAVYFPSQDVDFQGNFSGNYGCLQVVADKVNYTGSATFNNNCAGTGVKTISVAGDVMLVE
jgi:hypothetical protein